MITFKYNRNKKLITYRGKIKKVTKNDQNTIKKKKGFTHKYILRKGGAGEEPIKDTPTTLKKTKATISDVLKEAKLTYEDTYKFPLNFESDVIMKEQLKKILINAKKNNNPNIN